MINKINLGILSILLGLGGFIFYHKYHAGATDVRNALAKENRILISMLMNDLRRAGASTIRGVPADGKSYSTIRFNRDEEVDNVIYERVGSRHEQLIRIQSGKQETVANHVSKFQLKRQAARPDLIEVSLAVEQHENIITDGLRINSNFNIKTRNK